MFLVLSRGTLNLSQAQVHETGVSGRERGRKNENGSGKKKRNEN